MGLKNLFSKKSPNTSSETNKAEAGPLVKALTFGSAAALGSAQLAALWGIPQFAVPISVVAFLGGSLYGLLSSKTQKSALATMEADGLTPKGKSISNGLFSMFDTTKKKSYTNNSK